MKKLRINVVSESDLVPGQGVNTAFHEMVDALRENADADVFINSEEPCDIVHIHTIGTKALRVLLRGEEYGKRVVTVHIVPESLIGSIRLAAYTMPLMRAYMRFFYGRADIVFAISREVERTLISELKVPPDKIRILYNCVDMCQYQLKEDEREKSRAQLGFSKENFVVVGVGQLQPRKRIDSFIETARKMPEATFIWVGGIPFMALGAEAGKMNLLKKTAPKNVIFTGIIEHKLVHDYLAAANVFFLPSEQENHPMCVLEAAGMGLPIVLRDITEYDDTFRGDALLGTDADFAVLLNELKQPENAQKAREGSARIAEKYDAPAFANHVMTYYHELLGDK